MPQVTLKTGIVDDGGHEEVLTDYQCDWPGCPNIAECVVGAVRELRAATAVCREHAARLKAPGERM